MPIQKAGEQVATAVSKEDLRPGQKVRYHPVGGGMQVTEGIVKKVITQSEIAGDTAKMVKATEDEPRVIIENLHTHKETAYKIENVEQILEEGTETVA
ncbi:GOLD domain-containing protein [Gigaspora margarita]|uniref:GOLD domain-containing protein n=1 Tax=Gigaspora margarita TaxID=4874 RepID=A0A8H4AD32_GIGMA|nr:GOLD domain-containing protein [Gigaspora margarita]